MGYLQGAADAATVATSIVVALNWVVAKVMTRVRKKPQAQRPES